MALAMPAGFPVPASALALMSTRGQKLQDYLQDMVVRAAAAPPTPPSLLAFLQPPPFTATATPVADCLAVLGGAGCVAALAILRAHPTSERVQRAACERIRQLAEAGEGGRSG